MGVDASGSGNGLISDADILWNETVLEAVTSRVLSDTHIRPLAKVVAGVL
jgi:hypothetical protein